MVLVCHLVILQQVEGTVLYPHQARVLQCMALTALKSNQILIDYKEYCP